ncbi:hypothetical protein D9M71_586550 [compost metagenome]
MGHGQVRVATERTTIDCRGDLDDVRGLYVALRAGHQPEYPRPAGHHDHAGGSGCQYQFLAALGVIVGELLRQGATPGHTDDVNLAIVEVVEHARGELCQAGEAIRASGGGRATDAGNVEGNHLKVRIKCLDEREHQLQVGTDAIENEQGRQVRLAWAHSGADGLAIQIDSTEDVRLRHALSPLV